MNKLKKAYLLTRGCLHTEAKWDVLAPQQLDAADYACAHINPPPSHTSLGYILAHDGEWINDRFRNNRPNSKDRELQTYVASHSTDRDLVLYRGVGDAVFSMMKENAAPFPGTDLVEKSFLYASLVKGCEIQHKLRLRIYTPAGTPLVYLGDVDGENRFEVAVQTGSRLRIVSIDKHYINCRILATD